MNREIKFRGISKESKKIVRGCLLTSDIPVSRIPIKAQIHQAFADEPSVMVSEVLFNTIGQFTGFYDSEFNRIFEGDIIHYIQKSRPNAKKNNRAIRKEIVYWNESFGQWRVKEKIDSKIDLALFKAVLFDNETKVIGNIHENPELL